MDRCRALIVDEDRSFVERLGRSFAAIGFSPDNVRDRPAALDYLRQRRPAIVVLTVERPDDSRLATEIRRAASDIPLLLVPGGSGIDPSAESELAPANIVAGPKGDLDETAILTELNKSLRLGLDRSELERLAASAGSVASPRGGRAHETDMENDSAAPSPETPAAVFERWRTRLEEAEKSHRAAIHDGAARHRAELAAVESECRAELDGLGQRQAAEWQRRLDNEIHALEEQQRAALQERENRHAEEQEALRQGHARALEERTVAQREEFDRELEQLAGRHREELRAEREAHRLEVESLREIRTKLEAGQRESSQELERLTSTLAATRAELESAQETHRAEVAKLQELRGTIQHRERENVEELERITANLEDDLTHEASRRVSELEETEKRHRTALAGVESRQREQIELMGQLHQEEIEQLQARSTRDRERLEREQVSTLRALAEEQRDTNNRILEQREAEWRAKLEQERSEHAQILATERAEFRIVLDAVRGIRSEPAAGSPEAASPAEPVQPSLLEVVEQLESALVPDETGDSAPRDNDPGSGRSD